MLFSSISVAQDLELILGDRSVAVSSAVRDGTTYYRFRDFVPAFQLSFREAGDQLIISGPRGEIRLVAGRPLARIGEEYLLLSEPVLRDSRGEWYVPIDFIPKVLQSLTESRIVRTGRTTYRVDLQNTVPVEMEVHPYPNRLSLVFRVNGAGSGELREFSDHLELTFSDPLVESENLSQPAGDELVASVGFFSRAGSTGFRIGKGRRFGDFRKYELSDPPRVVIDIFAGSSSRSASTVTIPSFDREEPPQVSVRESDVPDATADLSPPRMAVVIDPGHGGSDYGVDVLQDVLEKGLALDLSRKIERRLNDWGQRARLTRSRDVALGTEQRSAVTNYFDASLFLTLHIGGAPSPSVKGPLVYVYGPPPGEGPDEGSGAGQAEELEAVELLDWEEAQLNYLSQSQRLAALIQNDLNDLFGVENDVVEAPLSVLAPVAAPAIFIEAGFLTNPDDRDRLSSDDFQEQVADTIALAVRRYLEAG